ncbi:MAG TPA: hypothetical protein VIV12_15340 [Streptosporangiaceae bacterium]
MLTLTAKGRRLLAYPGQLWRVTAAGLLSGNDFSVFAGELFLALLLDTARCPVRRSPQPWAKRPTRKDSGRAGPVSHRANRTSTGLSTAQATCAGLSACWRPAVLNAWIQAATAVLDLGEEPCAGCLTVLHELHAAVGPLTMEQLASALEAVLEPDEPEGVPCPGCGQVHGPGDLLDLDDFLGNEDEDEVLGRCRPADRPPGPGCNARLAVSAESAAARGEPSRSTLMANENRGRGRDGPAPSG